ncbi:sulfotransferase [Pelagibacteraceae bacterium]|nr:sulfotransferase [Pelagibacteraceae bacterium]
MNRHERRKQKKNNKINQTVSPYLLEGIKHHTHKNYEKAETLYKKVLKSDPSNYETVRHLGILNQDLENYREAYNFYLKAIQINPRGFEAINNLGTIHLHNHNYDLALKSFNKSFEINRNYIPTINNLAGYYHKVHEPKKAIEFSLKALSIQPNNPLTRDQHAKALMLNSRPAEAIKILEQLILDYPDNDDFKINLSTAYKEMGEFKKSDEISSQGFKKNYKKIPYLLDYTNNKKNKLNDEQISYYDSLLEKEDLHFNDKTLISYAFYTYYKNQKEYKKAGDYLIKGNKIQYSAKKFDLEKEQLFFNKIQKLFSRNIDFAFNEKLLSQIPIFVCGMPRSGTTLCEQILSSHSKVTGAGELTYLAESSNINRIISPTDNQIKDFEETLNNEKSLMNARRIYLEQLNLLDKKNSTYICDKMPHNFILIGFIKLILPEAKIIYCKRDPIDNCFSLYAHKFVELSHQYSYDQKMLASYYKMHTKLMKFWLNKYKKDIFILDNEELVNNQEKVSKQLITFCDLKWEKECLDFHKTKRQVRTASIEQVRTPINNKSIGAWKRYENYLQELVTNLK